MIIKKLKHAALYVFKTNDWPSKVIDDRYSANNFIFKFEDNADYAEVKKEIDELYRENINKYKVECDNIPDYIFKELKTMLHETQDLFNTLEDKVIICRDCNKEFIWTKNEQLFYKQLGLEGSPCRCKKCKKERNERYRNAN